MNLFMAAMRQHARDGSLNRMGGLSGAAWRDQMRDDVARQIPADHTPEPGPVEPGRDGEGVGS